MNFKFDSVDDAVAQIQRGGLVIVKDKESEEQKSRTAVRHDYHVLFNNEITYSKLASLISKGAKIKKTNI